MTRDRDIAAAASRRTSRLRRGDTRWGRSGRRAQAAFRHGRLLMRNGSAPMWLHVLLLALAPVLVFSFYSVVQGAVERGAARWATPPAHTADAPLQQVVWDCTGFAGVGPHNACRAVPANRFGEAIRVSATGD